MVIILAPRSGESPAIKPCIIEIDKTVLFFSKLFILSTKDLIGSLVVGKIVIILISNIDILGLIVLLKVLMLRSIQFAAVFTKSV